MLTVNVRCRLENENDSVRLKSSVGLASLAKSGLNHQNVSVGWKNGPVSGVGENGLPSQAPVSPQQGLDCRLGLGHESC